MSHSLPRLQPQQPIREEQSGFDCWTVSRCGGCTRPHPSESCSSVWPHFLSRDQNDFLSCVRTYCLSSSCSTFPSRECCNRFLTPPRPPFARFRTRTVWRWRSSSVHARTWRRWSYAERSAKRKRWRRPHACSSNKWQESTAWVFFFCKQKTVIALMKYNHLATYTIHLISFQEYHFVAYFIGLISM